MNYQKLYECLFCAVRTAGIVANMMQATIVNEGKQVEVVEDEDERHLRMREAKTRADEIVQEILLQSVLPEYQAVPVSYTHLDVYKRQQRSWGPIR